MMECLHEHGDGRRVTRYRIASDRLDVSLLTLGSILEEVRLDGGPNMTAPPGDLENRPGDAALIGPVVGPVVNRLTMPVTLDGSALPLEPVLAAGFVLHSGAGGTQDRVWDTVETSRDRLVLAIELADGVGGFPGRRRIVADWRVTGDTLSLRIAATTDRPTLMNVAHHPYWALDGPEAGRGGHLLRSPATRFTPSTPLATPTGEIRDVAGSDYDFRAPRAPSPGLDANLCLADAPSPDPMPAATLTSEGGRRLEILTTAPGLQVFTGRPYGIALEPQFWPDAPAHPAFPSIRLDPGKPFRQTTLYRFARV